MKYIWITSPILDEVIYLSTVFRENKLDSEIAVSYGVTSGINVYFEDSQLETVIDILKENEKRNERIRQLGKDIVFNKNVMQEVRIDWEKIEVK